MQTHQSRNQAIPGVTDIPFSQAVAEFVFMSNIIGEGHFIPPSQSYLSPFVVQLPASFSEQIICVNDNGEIFIALSETLSEMILPLDFSVAVSKTQFALSVKILGIVCVVKIPFITEVCEAFYLGQDTSGLEVIAGDSALSPVEDDSLSFLSELETDALAAKAISASSDREITFKTFYTPFGSDFGIRIGDEFTRSVPLNPVSETLLAGGAQ